MVGIRDIAREVGVSISTVSYALNGTRPISADMRQRIMEAVERLGYRPDVRGRNLAAMRTHGVGVVIPSIRTYYIAPLLAAIDQSLYQRGYHLLISHVGRRESFRHKFAKGQIDGVIVVISLTPGDRESSMWADQLRESELPCVVINRIIPGLSCVQTDYKKGVISAMNHLIAMGHRQIGFVGANAKDPTQGTLLSGYRYVLDQHGICPHEAWIAKDSQAAFAQWKQSGWPTAAFVAGQYHTFPFYRYARAMHVHIPNDVAVVGFDDDTNEADLWPGLTTVAQPHDEVGNTAVRLLMRGIRTGQMPEKKVLISPKLIVRASCGFQDDLVWWAEQSR